MLLNRNNGAAHTVEYSLNPSKRGWNGQLVTYVTALGAEAITGTPYKPTTQGKNERFHQTLFRWLDKQPLCDTLAQLQTQLDEFDRIYNIERPHQALPGRITPAQAYAATALAEPPRPVIVEPLIMPGKSIAPRDAVQPRRSAHTGGGIEGPKRLVSAIGLACFQGTNYSFGKQLAGLEVWAVQEPESVAFFMPTGDHLFTYPVPWAGVRYLSKRHALDISADLMRVSPMS